MLNNFFKTIWRTILRQKVYTTINILGLSLGICASLVLYFIINYELSFDTFHADKERIYRIMGDVTESTGDISHFSRLPMPLVQTSRGLSGVEAIAGIIPYNAKINIADSGKSVKDFESTIAGTHYVTTIIAEPQYFEIFKYEWLVGNAQSALKDPSKVVLTESKARQYFGTMPLDKIIGKQVIYDDSLKASVSGIVKDWNKNSDLKFTDFISFSTIHDRFLKNNFRTDSWKQGDMNTWFFTKLSSQIAPTKINIELAKLVKIHADSQIKLTLWLEPLSDIHFNANVIENPIRTAHLPTLYGLMSIAVFILLLAIINFVNLSTAQSIYRIKEVSIRKILGSGRMSLIFQSLAETLVYTLIAVILAVSLVNPVLNGFQSFIPAELSFHFFEPAIIIFLILTIIIIPVLAGLYPALELSSKVPVSSLKGIGVEKGSQKWLLRKSLIVFQFSVSLIFIIGSIVIADQLHYTREKDLGFTSDAIIILESPRGENGSKIGVLAEKIKQIASVKNVALQWRSPMHENPRGMRLKFKSSDLKETGVAQVAGDENFIPLYKIKLLAGRNIVKSDSVNEFVINENLSKFMGNKKPEKALGKLLYWNNIAYPIVGVVADFHTSSLHEPIKPLCIINRKDRESSIAIKLSAKGEQSGAIKNTLLQIENIWKQIYVGKTFDYQFYDDSLALLYEKDQKTAKLMNTAMFIAIFISCMGLFGLGMFTAQRRTKEIGIRKVLGAGVVNLVILLSKDFMFLVVFSLLIASPIAWYFMNKWLQGFAYRINIEWWVFVLAGVSAIIIALLTVSYQAIKAALMNPVKSLKTE